MFYVLMKNSHGITDAIFYVPPIPLALEKTLYVHVKLKTVINYVEQKL